MPGSGVLGSIEVKAPEDPDLGVRRLDIYQDALSTVQSRGIFLSGPPQGYKGEMPRDVTSLDDDELGDILGRLSEYIGFLDGELSAAQSAMNGAEAQYEFLCSRIRVGIKARAEGKLTDKDRTDLVNIDPRVVEAKAKTLYSETVWRLTRNVFNTAQRNWDTISRRITQRGQEIDRMKRESNVAGIQIPQGRTFRRPGK